MRSEKKNDFFSMYENWKTVSLHKKVLKICQTIVLVFQKQLYRVIRCKGRTTQKIHLSQFSRNGNGMIIIYFPWASPLTSDSPKWLQNLWSTGQSNFSEPKNLSLHGTLTTFLTWKHSYDLTNRNLCPLPLQNLLIIIFSPKTSIFIFYNIAFIEFILY